MGESKLYNPVRYTAISSESVMTIRYAAWVDTSGSPDLLLVLNGKGGTGFGWKYGVSI